MTTIEVLNITYESNRIQECKIIINGEEFNATWDDPEYIVTDKKGSKGRGDLGADDEEISEVDVKSNKINERVRRVTDLRRNNK